MSFNVLILRYTIHTFYDTRLTLLPAYSFLFDAPSWLTLHVRSVLFCVAAQGKFMREMVAVRNIVVALCSL